MSRTEVASRRIIANTTALSAAGLWRIGASFLVQLLVARQLGAAGLGAYALGMALLNVAQIVVEAGLPALLVRELPAAPERRLRTFRLARAVMTAVGLAAALIGVLFAWLVAGSGTQWLPFALLFLSLPFYGLFSSTLTMFEAGERFDLVLLVDGLTNGLLMVATLAVLLAGGGLGAIFLTLTLVQAGSALLGHLLLSRLRAWFASGGSAEEAPITAAERLGLVRRAAPTFALALSDVLQQRIDLLLVGALAGPTVTGLYAAANGLVRVLVKLAHSWWRALFPTLSRMRAQAAAQGERLLAMSTRLGSAAIVLAALLLTTTARPLLVLFFGAEYAEATPTLQLLVWSAPWYLLAARAVVLLLLEGRPRAALAVSVSNVVAALLFMPGAVQVWHTPGAAGATLAASLFAALAGAWLLARPWLLRGAEAKARALHEAQPVRSGQTWPAPLLGMGITLLALYLPGGAVLQSLAAVTLCLLALLALRLLVFADLLRVVNSLRSIR